MANQVFLLSPVGEPPSDTAAVRVLDKVAGNVIAIVNNGWGCMDFFSDYMGREMKESYGASKVVHFSSSPTSGLGPEKAGKLVEECDGAIVGLGN